MINYTWSISRLDCAPLTNNLTNVIKIAHWTYTAQDENGVTASCSNSYQLPEPNPEYFTDYSTIKEETIIEWLQNSLDVEYLKTVLAKEIEEKYVPPIIPLSLPWIKESKPEILEEPILESNGEYIEEFMVDMSENLCDDTVE